MKKFRLLSFIAVLLAAMFVFTACSSTQTVKDAEQWDTFIENTHKALIDLDSGYTIKMSLSGKDYEGTKISISVELSVKDKVVKIKTSDKILDEIEKVGGLPDEIVDFLSDYSLKEFYIVQSGLGLTSKLKLVIKKGSTWVEEDLGALIDEFPGIDLSTPTLKALVVMLVDEFLYPFVNYFIIFDAFELKGGAYQLKEGGLSDDEYFKLYFGNDKLSKFEIKLSSYDEAGKNFITASVSFKFGISNISVPTVA